MFELCSETDWLVYADWLQEQGEPLKEAAVREEPTVNCWTRQEVQYRLEFPTRRAGSMVDVMSCGNVGWGCSVGTHWITTIPHQVGSLRDFIGDFL